MSAPIYKGGRPFFDHALRFGGGGNVHLPVTKAGAPVNGTSGDGAGTSGPGSLLIDYTNAIMYINTGTKLSPTWSAFETAGGGAAPAASFSTPADPTGTTSATLVMMGLTGAITPLVSGRIVLNINGNMVVSATTDKVTGQLSYGTGTAPVNGAAVAGTQIGSLQAFTGLTGVLEVPFSVQAVITGLVVGTAYWLDMALKTSAGTGSLTAVAISAYEV